MANCQHTSAAAAVAGCTLSVLFWHGAMTSAILFCHVSVHCLAAVSQVDHRLRLFRFATTSVDGWLASNSRQRAASMIRYTYPSSASNIVMIVWNACGCLLASLESEGSSRRVYLLGVVNQRKLVGGLSDVSWCRVRRSIVRPCVFSLPLVDGFISYVVRELAGSHSDVVGRCMSEQVLLQVGNL